MSSQCCIQVANIELRPSRVTIVTLHQSRHAHPPRSKQVPRPILGRFELSNGLPQSKGFLRSNIILVIYFNILYSPHQGHPLLQGQPDFLFPIQNSNVCLSNPRQWRMREL
jgi:hypothetical protein